MKFKYLTPITEAFPTASEEALCISVGEYEGTPGSFDNDSD